MNAIESLAKALRQRARLEAEGDEMLDSFEHAQYPLPPGVRKLHCLYLSLSLFELY